MRFTNLADWLAWQETLHPRKIELGLARIETVFQRLHAGKPSFTVITVAGTNGKGSSVAMLEAILLAAGYRTGVYTSPHLLYYNERIRLNGEAVADEALVDAFSRIDAARDDISLTYFEFGTLAALDIFYRQPLDVVVLEVGLGGRLDAVNIIDADIALITSISLDHTAWLGEDRESIAKEKAGIMRRGRPVVFSGHDIPQAVMAAAAALDAPLYALGQAYTYEVMPSEWLWRAGRKNAVSLPLPALPGRHQVQNAAGVLMALDLLSVKLPVGQSAIRQGLSGIRLGGRFQIIAGEPVQVFDVAHNPDAMARLAEMLAQYPVAGRTLAVIGMLQDKDIAASLGKLAPRISEWYAAGLPTARGIPAPELVASLLQINPQIKATAYVDVAAACAAAKKDAQAGDRILVCGSFYTVADALRHNI